MEISKLTWKEIDALPRDTLFFISISPMEAHGPHLPIATDFEIARNVEKEVIKLLEEKGIRCVTLPPLPLGVCRYLEGFAGTISTHWKILHKLLLDIFKSFAGYGFKYFMIINFHMDLMHIKALYKAIKKARKYGIIACEPLSAYYFRGELFEDAEEEVHADVKETSLALYLFPDDVKNYKIEDFKVKFNLFNSLKKFKEIGVKEAYIGSPSKASKEYGEELFKRLVEKCYHASLMLREGKVVEMPKKLKILLGI